MKKPKVIKLKNGILVCGDAAKILPKNVPDESVDLVLTSPPYDELRSYKGYTFDFKAIARELVRTLKPGGVIVWVVGDATVKGSETCSSFNQALYFKKLGLRLHDTMLWIKTNPVPGAANQRYRGAFEYMFCFSKGKPKTFNKKEWLPKNQMKFNEKFRLEKHGRTSYLEKGLTSSGVMKDKINEKGMDFNTGVHPNVFFYAGGTQIIKRKRGPRHPAIFPDRLAEDQIRTWTNPGDVVLDPFLGSGTSCKIAELLSREYVGIEISEEYLDGAATAIKDAEGFNQMFEPEEPQLEAVPVDFD